MSTTGRRPGVLGTGAKVAGIVIVLIVALSGYYYFVSLPNSRPPSIIIFSADAYVAESAYLGSGFANSTGAAYVTPTSAGSLALAQQIRAGAQVSDFISVSRSAVTSTYLGNRSSGWAIAFAGDQMVLAYVNATSYPPGMSSVLSAYATARVSNSTADWKTLFGIISSGTVKVGIANPNADPAGYRGWLVLEAAGYTYASSNQTYFSSQMMTNHGNVSGASAAALIAPLQTGNLDLLFIYRSAAISHRLAYLTLPRQVSLGDPTLGSYYSKFTYTIATGVQKGGAIVLFVTVPNNSTATAQALEFVKYLVSHTSSLNSYGLAVFSPPTLYNSTAVPSEIGQLASSGSVALGGTL